MPAHLPGQLLAAIVLMRFYLGYHWDEISKELLVHSETSRQAYKRVEGRSEDLSDVRLLLDACEPKKP